ncbi:hypothetical protein CHS0354_027659 [Potamilus streckersoni]|uniref:Uncharacterized protein n=1 Tax=Potamilus streckersoni TaxID=2493646 RepID=A0AAE0W490_9BIVA|nr:hypothetical protein CHS0354_027659 [Potamilus streckersoni]
MTFQHTNERKIKFINNVGLITNPFVHFVDGYRYVRENYFIYDELETNIEATVPAAVNWVTYTYDRCSTEYVPTELFHGLVNCGKEYALYAVKAPAALIELLHVDLNSVPTLDMNTQIKLPCDVKLPTPKFSKWLHHQTLRTEKASVSM